MMMIRSLSCTGHLGVEVLVVAGPDHGVIVDHDPELLQQKVDICAKPPLPSFPQHHQDAAPSLQCRSANTGMKNTHL